MHESDIKKNIMRLLISSKEIYVSHEPQFLCSHDVNMEKHVSIAFTGKEKKNVYEPHVKLERLY